MESLSKSNIRYQLSDEILGTKKYTEHPRYLETPDWSHL